jgi:hypothetical protein
MEPSIRINWYPMFAVWRAGVATIMGTRFSNPQAIATAGEEIYKSFQQDLEQTHRGQFVAVNVKTKGYHLGESAEAALENARAAEPDGLFHLIRIGFPGAFQISHAFQNPSSDWLSQ